MVELLRAFGGPAGVLGATPAQLRNVVPDAIASRVTARADDAAAARTHAWLEAPEHVSLPGATTLIRRRCLRWAIRRRCCITSAIRSS